VFLKELPIYHALKLYQQNGFIIIKNAPTQAYRDGELKSQKAEDAPTEQITTNVNQRIIRKNLS
jgi:hypothetical protein